VKPRLVDLVRGQQLLTAKEPVPYGYEMQHKASDLDDFFGDAVENPIITSIAIAFRPNTY
jgi:hypothetical protein